MDFQKWIGQKWIGHNWSNQDGQNGDWPKSVPCVSGGSSPGGSSPGGRLRGSKIRLTPSHLMNTPCRQRPVQAKTLWPARFSLFRPAPLEANTAFRPTRRWRVGPRRVEARASHDRPRAQTCTFEGPGLQKHHQNSTKGPPKREKKRTNFAAGEIEKKERNFGAVRLRGGSG